MRGNFEEEGHEIEQFNDIGQKIFFTMVGGDNAMMQEDFLAVLMLTKTHFV